MDKKYKAVAITVTHKPVDEFDFLWMNLTW